mmetsp:Transcript_140619/g.262333  ORF Transcript_140619/g.262333 Transcript_140619/m.262333 type:complete len:285 (-) Transcript_140619:38-892(-)
MAWPQCLRSARLPLGVLGASLPFFRRPLHCQDGLGQQQGNVQTAVPSSSNNAKFFRISYTSTMKGDVTLAGQTLESIVQKSVFCNARSSISGMVCYDTPLKHVWQVFEGSEDDVATLWERISKDSRHVIDQDSISCEEVEDRRYPKGWGMRYSRFNQSGEGDLQKGGHSAGEILQVMYKSFLKDQGGGELQVMEEVAQKAVLKNAKLDVTGWLLYNDRTLTVYQVLEGPPEVVDKIADAIMQDPRHDVCRNSVRRKVIEQREFPTWSMSLDTVQQPEWSSAAAY